MLPANNNFRLAFPDLKCRFCPSQEETQEHLLEECPRLHLNEESKTPKSDLFKPYDRDTAKTAEKIQRIVEKLEEDKGPLAKRTKAKFPCIECKKQCRNGQNCIECETCKEWVHLKCTHLTIAQFTDIIADEKIQCWAR